MEEISTGVDTVTATSSHNNGSSGNFNNTTSSSSSSDPHHNTSSAMAASIMARYAQLEKQHSVRQDLLRQNTLMRPAPPGPTLSSSSSSSSAIRSLLPQEPDASNSSRTITTVGSSPATNAATYSVELYDSANFSLSLTFHSKDGSSDEEELEDILLLNDSCSTDYDFRNQFVVSSNKGENKNKDCNDEHDQEVPSNNNKNKYGRARRKKKRRIYNKRRMPQQLSSSEDDEPNDELDDEPDDEAVAAPITGQTNKPNCDVEQNRGTANRRTTRRNNVKRNNYYKALISYGLLFLIIHSAILAWFIVDGIFGILVDDTEDSFMEDYDHNDPQWVRLLRVVTSRFVMVGFNVLLVTGGMKTFEVWLLERISQWKLRCGRTQRRTLVDCTYLKEANVRIHRWNGVLVGFMALVHVYSVFLPDLSSKNDFSVRVDAPGEFDWPLSEQASSRANVISRDEGDNTKVAYSQIDDIISMATLSILLLILLPLSLYWMNKQRHQRWSNSRFEMFRGPLLHHFVITFFFLELIRQRNDFLNWVVNCPFFVLWLLDKVYWSTVWRRQTSQADDVRRVRLGRNYMILLWKPSSNGSMQQIRNGAGIGAKCRWRLNDETPSCLTSPAEVTVFENRGVLRGLNLASRKPSGKGGGNKKKMKKKDWLFGCIMRVPPKAKGDNKIRRLYDISRASLLWTTWGPYAGISHHVEQSLKGCGKYDYVVLVGSGSGVNFLIDACQFLVQQQKEHLDKNKQENTFPEVLVLFTTIDQHLYDLSYQILHQLLSPPPARKRLRRLPPPDPIVARCVLALPASSASLQHEQNQKIPLDIEERYESNAIITCQSTKIELDRELSMFDDDFDDSFSSFHEDDSWDDMHFRPSDYHTEMAIVTRPILVKGTQTKRQRPKKKGIVFYQGGSPKTNAEIAAVCSRQSDHTQWSFVGEY